MSGSFVEHEAFEGNKYMSNNNVTKFQHIVAGLAPDKKEALYRKMKSLPETTATMQVIRMELMNLIHRAVQN